MGISTRLLLAAILVSIPAGAALADDDALAEAPERRGQVTRYEPPAPEDMDTASVDALRDADRDDLDSKQLAVLQSEVDRLNMMEAKAMSDGEMSDRDAARLYRSAVRSCDKIMDPGKSRQSATRTGPSRGSVQGNAYLPSEHTDDDVPAPTRGKRTLRPRN